VLFHARKFRTAGPIALTVSRTPAGVAFAVTYEGPRLHPGDAEASLELYYPARHRDDQILCTTGLGLGLIRRVARLIGGELTYRVDDAGRATATLDLSADQVRE
jgi:K+-sensing histidine kinase KdpD